MNNVLLSVRPQFARMITAGTKTVEIRRRSTRLRPGDRLVLYVSLPVGAVVGQCEVDCVLQRPVAALFDEIGDQCGLSFAAFRRYLKGASAPTAIKLRNVRLFPTPVEISTIKQTASGFVFPQSYRFLDREETRLISRAGHAKP